MAHSRDIRIGASEVKFLVDLATAAVVREWARAYLDPDPHGVGVYSDEYRTTSLYFDTDDYDVFHRRGSFGRGKYRIRRYGDDETVFLERKMRQATVLAKRRTRADITTLEQLARPHLDPAWSGYWFHRRVITRRLRPVCQVSYHRMARLLTRNGQQARLTLDADLRARTCGDVRFVRCASAPIAGGSAILELKFTGPAPTLFRRLIQDLSLNPQTASKYRMGITSVHGFSSSRVRGFDLVNLGTGEPANL